MELKEFVKKVLIDISEGVNEARESIVNLDGIINPPSRDFAQINSHNICTVDFNIAISVSEEDFSKTGGKLTVFSMATADSKTSSTQNNSTLSTIAFKVPIAFPADKKILEAHEKKKEWVREDLSSGKR